MRYFSLLSAISSPLNTSANRLLIPFNSSGSTFPSPGFQPLGKEVRYDSRRGSIVGLRGCPMMIVNSLTGLGKKRGKVLDSCIT